MKDAYEIKQLDPQKTVFKRSSGGVLTLKTNGFVHPEIHLYRAFPLSRKNQFISVRSPKGDEIGMIEDLEQLDQDSRFEAEKELRLRYLVPQITQIDKIKQNPGMWVWHLQTTLGPIKLSMRNLHEHVHLVGSARVLLSDVDGNRCEIVDIDKLDAQSRKQLAKVI